MNNNTSSHNEADGAEEETEGKDWSDALGGFCGTSLPVAVEEGSPLSFAPSVKRRSCESFQSAKSLHCRLCSAL